MNQAERKRRSEQTTQGNRSAPLWKLLAEFQAGRRLRELLPWLACAACVFGLLYGSSYFALLWLPPYQGVDPRSELAADYRPWTFVAFQPVDHALIEEIRQERKLPEQLIQDGSFWPTPAGLPAPKDKTQAPDLTPEVSQTQASTPAAASSALPASPTASPPSETPVLTPAITASLLKPSATPKPTATLKPAEPARPTETQTPAKPPRPGKPPKPNKDPRPTRPPKPATTK